MSKPTKELQALRTRKHTLRTKYGMTLDDYNSKVRFQNNKCATCHEVPIGQSKQSKTLAVDHSHITGEVRDLLCRNCNLALGNMKDNPIIAFNLYLYLRKYSDYGKWFDGK